MTVPEEVILLAASVAAAQGGDEAAFRVVYRALIGALPRDQAEAIQLRVVVGLDAEAAGRMRGKRPGAVRTAGPACDNRWDCGAEEMR